MCCSKLYLLLLIIFFSSLINVLVCTLKDSEIADSANFLRTHLLMSITEDKYSSFAVILGKHSCQDRSATRVKFQEIANEPIDNYINNNADLTVMDKFFMLSCLYCGKSLYAFLLRLSVNDAYLTDFSKRVFTYISIKATIDSNFKQSVIDEYSVLYGGDTVSNLINNYHSGDYSSLMHEIWDNPKHKRPPNDPKKPPPPIDVKSIVTALINEEYFEEWGNARNVLDSVLLDHTIQQTNDIFVKYKDERKDDLDSAIKDYRKGDLLHAYQVIIRYLRDINLYDIERFNECIDDFNKGYVWIVVLILCLEDSGTLVETDSAYLKAYGRTLLDKIQALPNGIFKSMIVDGYLSPR